MCCKRPATSETAFTRDTARKRQVLQTRGADDIRQVSPNSHDPIYFAGVAVQATLSLPLLSPDANGGLRTEGVVTMEVSHFLFTEI